MEKNHKNLSKNPFLTNIVTRWYPRGIQKLVSTYDLLDSGPTRGREYSGVKTENTQSAKICLNFNFREGDGGGGGVGVALWSEIPERGSLENLDTNLLFEATVQKPACASQIVSHIIDMWRLTNKKAKHNVLVWDLKPNGSSCHPPI